MQISGSLDSKAQMRVRLQFGTVKKEPDEPVEPISMYLDRYARVVKEAVCFNKAGTL
jgi:hypothetical protein